MKSIMKLSSLLFMLCIGMMCFSVNSHAMEDHEQNSKDHVLSIHQDASMVQIAISSTEFIYENKQQDLTIDYLKSVQVKSMCATPANKYFLQLDKSNIKFLEPDKYRYQKNLFDPTRNK